MFPIKKLINLTLLISVLSILLLAGCGTRDKGEVNDTGGTNHSAPGETVINGRA